MDISAHIPELNSMTQRTIVTSPDISGWVDIHKNIMALEPVVDGDIIPDYPYKIFESDKTFDVDILTGSNSEE